MKKLITLKSSEEKSGKQLSDEVEDVVESKGFKVGKADIEVLFYRRWLIIPAGILLALLLSKSILVAFVVGFGITVFLDKQSIRTKELNRLAILSLLYLIGFSVLIVVLLKVTHPSHGVFYSIGENELLFDKHTYYQLVPSEILRNL